MFKLFSRLRPVLAAAAIGLAVQAVPASAAIYDAGTLNPVAPYANVAMQYGSFLDIFRFNLASESDVAASIASLNLSVGPNNIYNIDDVYLGLFSLSAPSTLMAWGTTALSFSGLDAGDYFIRVTGNANGIFGGGYLFGLTALPVPEPEQWMLFAAGLLAVGSMVRRRS